MFKLPGLTIVALLLATILAAAQPACLPKSVFVKNSNEELPLLHLGPVDNVLTLCAYERVLDPSLDKLLGVLDRQCGDRSPRRVRRKGHSGPGPAHQRRRAELHRRLLHRANPRKRNQAILRHQYGRRACRDRDRRLLYIFATDTKAKVAEIKLKDPDAPDQSNVSNMPWGLLYNGDTVFVFGQDAGPFTGAWVFKENGSRSGIWRRSRTLNIFNGGYGVLGRDKVALGDAGLQNMTIVSGANAAKQITKRAVSYAPCTKAQFEVWTEGDNYQQTARAGAYLMPNTSPMSTYRQCSFRPAISSPR